MKVNEIITLTHEVLGSAGYSVYPVLVENLALVHTTTEPPVSGLVGAPVKRHFTFLAVKSGMAKVQFAEFRRWELPHMHLENIIRIKVEKTDKVDKADVTDEALAAVAKLLAGGWTPFVEVEGQTDILKNAVGDEAFKAYTPLLVTSQVVGGGSNYIFVANLNLSLGGFISKRLVLVRVTQEGTNPAKLVNMQTPSFRVRDSSWNCVYKPADKPTDDLKELLAKAMDGFLGMGFEKEPVFAADQPDLNNSTVFVGNMMLSNIDRTTFPVLLTVVQDPGSTPVIVGIENVFDLV
jgi:hypothetical protein